MKATLLSFLLLTINAALACAVEAPAARPDTEASSAAHNAPTPAVSAPASDSSTPASSPAAAVLGTWRLAKADGQGIAVPFYMRLDADGSARLWPIESGCNHPEHRIAPGTYAIDAKTFTFLKEGAPPVASTYTLSDSTLTLLTPLGHELVYERVDNPPAPGHLPEEAAAAEIP